MESWTIALISSLISNSSYEGVGDQALVRGSATAFPMREVKPP